MIQDSDNNLIKIFENEFGRIKSGFFTNAGNKVQIVSYDRMPESPNFISTLGLNDLSSGNDKIRFEWFMEFSSDLSEEKAASALDYFLSLYLNKKFITPSRGSFILFPKPSDRIWEKDDFVGLYFTLPAYRSANFKKDMNNIGIIPVWVIPITKYELKILEMSGWKDLESYWDLNNVDLHSLCRK